MPDTVLHHFAVLAHPSLVQQASTLVAELRALGWSVFDAQAGPEPGAEVSRSREDGLSSSGWFVLLRSNTGSDAQLRSDLQRAVALRRADPQESRVLVVDLTPIPSDAPGWLTVNTLQAIKAHDGDLEEVARQLSELGHRRGLRWWGRKTASVAVLSVHAEAQGSARDVAQMVRALRGQVDRVEEVDLGSSGASEALEDCLLRVVVLGWSLAEGRAEAALRKVLEAPERTVWAFSEAGSRKERKAHQVDARLRERLLEEAEDLVAEERFIEVEDWTTLSGELRDPVAAALAVLQPKPDSGPVTLEPHEKAWLHAQSRYWKKGMDADKPGLLRSCATNERADLYVSLRAGPGPWAMLGEQVWVRRPEAPPVAVYRGATWTQALLAAGVDGCLAALERAGESGPRHSKQAAAALSAAWARQGLDPRSVLSQALIARLVGGFRSGPAGGPGALEPRLQPSDGGDLEAMGLLEPDEEERRTKGERGTPRPLRLVEPLPPHLQAAFAREGLDPAALLADIEAEPHPSQPTRPLLDQLISHPLLPHLAIVGEAGSGKTVLLQHVAWTLTCALLGDPEPQDAHLDLDALRRDRALPPLPVFIEARHLAAAVDTHGLGQALPALLADRLGVARNTAQVGLSSARYLLLFDSLDEVPTARGREQVAALLEHLVDSCPCRIVLSSRPAAHAGTRLPSIFLTVPIAPLDEAQRAAFVGRWEEGNNLDADQARHLPGALTRLQARFRDRSGRSRSPLENPLLLTCVLYLFMQKSRLPHNTAELLEFMVDHLCDRRAEGEGEQRDTNAAQRRSLLTWVGRALQDGGTTALSVAALARRMVAERGAVDEEHGRDQLDRLGVSTGLLRFPEEDGVRVVRPWHRSFQEFLAARDLAGQYEPKDVISTLVAPRETGLPHLLDDEWEGCLRFTFGVLGRSGEERAHGFASDLFALAAERQDDPRWAGRLLGIVAGGVVEYDTEHFQTWETREALPELLKQRFEDADGRWPWRDRLRVLEALGELAEATLDPRGQPGRDPRLPDPRLSTEGWTRVPQGEGHFWLRRWPVTEREYRDFETAADFGDKELWADGQQPGARSGWDAHMATSNEPAWGMDWYQARAFCRWAARHWRQPEGEGSFDLPSSAQWELAARLGHEAEWPWGKAEPGSGDEARANYSWGEDAPRRPTPVGLFHRGDMGPFLDLGGNVWEWTSTNAEGEECHLGDTPDEAPRVIRGGSWGDPSGYLRCAFRDGVRPGGRGPYLGLRLSFQSPARP